MACTLGVSLGWVLARCLFTCVGAEMVVVLCVCLVCADKTLRRNKRMQPITRVAARDAANMGAAGAPCM